MVGLHRVRPDLPCAPAVEVGWRLHPDHWGHGYATEGAGASLRHGFESGGLDEIVAFTTALNTRSQAVMVRLGMVRDAGGRLRPPGPARGQPAAAPRPLPGHAVAAGPYGGLVSADRSRRAVTGRAAIPEMVAYHDTEWGVPVHDDPTHFEFLVLEGAQAGLSWSTILKRRAGYRKAFAGFDVAKVARFTPARVEKLLRTPGIIRNRAKVESTVRNARAFLAVQEEFGSFDAYVWGFVGGPPHRQQVAAHGAVAGHSAESEALSKDLRRRGFGFVGPTVVLRPPAGDRAGQRPPGPLLPLRRAHRRRRMTTRVPPFPMTGSSGARPWRTSQSSAGPTSTKPSDA